LRDCFSFNRKTLKKDISVVEMISNF